MLRDIPESEAGHNDYERWWFEEQRKEWEEEQKQLDLHPQALTALARQIQVTQKT
jgi:hypothetical protein